MRRFAAWSLLTSLLTVSGGASAETFRLRADAYGYSNASDVPTGFVSLVGEDKFSPWVSAEASLWGGWGGFDRGPGDATILVVRLHDPKRDYELRLGRQIASTGAVHPVHFDGVDARARLPFGFAVESFGGVPVKPRFGADAYDWVVGGRVSQSALDGRLAWGTSYTHLRNQGQLVDEEVGANLNLAPARWLDIGLRGSFDLVQTGVSLASASVLMRFPKVRPELYAIHRSPSRLLPANSLFSALGDVPSEVVGFTIPWFVAPRLDITPTGAIRWVGDEVGYEARARATLRFDDLGQGVIALEARRQHLDADRWTGVRLATRIPIVQRWIAAGEFELVVPDESRGRGSAWPWGLLGLRFAPAASWEIAAAVEAASTPRSQFEVNAFGRVTKSWGPQ